MKPYYITVKQCGETRKVFESHNPADCIMYAKNNISRSGNVERIQMHDLTGPLECFFDKSWYIGT